MQIGGLLYFRDLNPYCYLSFGVTAIEIPGTEWNFPSKLLHFGGSDVYRFDELHGPSVARTISGFCERVSSDAEYRPFSMRTPITTATNRTNTDRYFSVFFDSFENCIDEVLSKHLIEVRW